MFVFLFSRYAQRAVLTVIALVSLSANAESSPSGLPAAAQFHARLSAIQSLSASFEQSIRDHEGHLTQQTRGEFKLRRPNHIYWETLPPYEQRIIANGQTLWIYDPDLEQVTVRAADTLSEGPIALFSESVESLQSKYKIERELRDTDEYFSLEAADDSAESGFETVQFIFNGTGVLSKIQFVDKLKQHTSVVFADQRINPNLSDAIFQFDIPDGVDVLRDD